MALTVGVKTIMDAKEVILVVTGQNKALALSQMIEGGVCHMVCVLDDRASHSESGSRRWCLHTCRLGSGSCHQDPA
jgi:hypothetical protein